MRGDELPLSDFLAVMRRLGVAPECYQLGYADGFNSEPVADWSQTEEGFCYRRGHWNGSQARARGAHREAGEREAS